MAEPCPAFACQALDDCPRSIVAAAEGDTEAARRAKAIAYLLIDKHR
jgi:hypothetical protein